MLDSTTNSAKHKGCKTFGDTGLIHALGVQTNSNVLNTLQYQAEDKMCSQQTLHWWPILRLAVRAKDGHIHHQNQTDCGSIKLCQKDFCEMTVGTMPVVMYQIFCSPTAWPIWQTIQRSQSEEGWGKKERKKTDTKCTVCDTFYHTVNLWNNRKQYTTQITNWKLTKAYMTHINKFKKCNQWSQLA